MAEPPHPGRITGPLKTWYDLHEALAHEATGLADDAAGLAADRLDAFAARFWAFDRELRAHSEVEDGIMFPAITRAGGTIEAALGQDHRDEQLAVYAVGSVLLHAKADSTADALRALAEPTAALRDSLVAHLQQEEATALVQVDGLFSDDEQARLFRTIISSLPADPQLQPWVAAALSPDHLEVRLRNIASAMAAGPLAALMQQIHDGVDEATWATIEARTPDLAALAGAQGGSTPR